MLGAGVGVGVHAAVAGGEAGRGGAVERGGGGGEGGGGRLLHDGMHRHEALRRLVLVARLTRAAGVKVPGRSRKRRVKGHGVIKVMSCDGGGRRRMSLVIDRGPDGLSLGSGLTEGIHTSNLLRVEITMSMKICVGRICGGRMRRGRR